MPTTRLELKVRQRATAGTGVHSALAGPQHSVKYVQWEIIQQIYAVQENKS